ncbi:MAG: TraB/GumN family protein [Caldimonas sp.]
MIRPWWLVAALLAAGLSLLAPLRGQARPASAPTGCPPAAIPLDSERFQAGMSQAEDHGFLWRIAKDGRTSYLYGTIHAARPAWMFPGPRTTAALEASDVLALELDLLDPDVQARLVKAANARPDERLPAALAARIERRMAAECVDAAPWREFAPEFQIASLAVLAARREGLDPSYAIDLVLALVARDLGKATTSLETPEAQIAALRMPTRQATIDFVTSGLDELEAGRSGPLLVHMATAWTDGNLAELEAFERWCGCLDSAAERASMKRLLDDRNPLLATAIDALHAGGRSVFAAVGSLHMIGANGLPALLHQRGFAVEQVRVGP